MRFAPKDRLQIGDRIDPQLARLKPITDGLKVSGRVKLELFGPDGHLLDVREVENIITTLGRNAITDQLLASPTLGKPTHMGVGTGAAAATIGDTTMTAEVRVALTSKTRSTNVLTLVGDYAAGVATLAITEAGTWDASSAGNLHSRSVFAVINKGANDTLKITWTWTLG